MIWRVSSVDVQSNMLSLELNNCCLAWHFRRWFIQALRLPDVYTVKSMGSQKEYTRRRVKRSLLRQLDHQLYPISESGPEWLAGVKGKLHCRKYLSWNSI
ncbi:uncharacterized protein [Solanum lycopersicum]|uniref:uncharacterized protein isoform X3 n=1 Tax=Solanum lycopersicum TaxID=4081 RepID=UPI0037481DB5